MSDLEFTEILPYNAQDLQQIVMDAHRYTEFTSWIKKVDVTNLGENKKHIAVLFRVPGIFSDFHYACELDNNPPGKVNAIAVDSPFRSMEGEMTFTTQPDGGTKVHCVLRYKTGFHPIALIASAIMHSQLQRGIDIAKEYLATRLTRVDAAPPPAAPAPVI